MDHEALFTATKWDILKLLEAGPKSPLELSKGLSSSFANISQQLRLLEMAGLVKATRVSNRDKDKPRMLYSINGNLSYVIATSDKFVDKKQLLLSDRNKIILRIWFLENQDVRYALEKTFWQIETQLSHLEKIMYAGLQNGTPVLEYNGDAKLPTKIEVGGAYGTVLLRHAANPAGHVLFEREKE